MSRIPLHKMEKARALEIPVFKLMCQVIESKVGKAVVDERGGELRKVVWNASRPWILEYATRPQTSSTGDKLPDFIVKKGDEAMLAIEVKNWALTSKWSLLTVQRDIIDRFCWLPSTCRRLLITTHLQAKTNNETYAIQRRVHEEGIRVFVLRNQVGPAGLRGLGLYKMLWKPLGESLSFMRKAKIKRRKRDKQKGQTRL